MIALLSIGAAAQQCYFSVDTVIFGSWKMLLEIDYRRRGSKREDANWVSVSSMNLCIHVDRAVDYAHVYMCVGTEWQLYWCFFQFSENRKIGNVAVKVTWRTCMRLCIVRWGWDTLRGKHESGDMWMRNGELCVCSWQCVCIDVALKCTKLTCLHSSVDRALVL